MATVQSLEVEIKKIKARNSRVEADKAWETSFTRRGIIAIGTYMFSVVFLVTIKAPEPALSALIPATAFLISSLTLPQLKEWWLSRRRA